MRIDMPYFMFEYFFKNSHSYHISIIRFSIDDKGRSIYNGYKTLSDFSKIKSHCLFGPAETLRDTEYWKINGEEIEFEEWFKKIKGLLKCV